jgi:hypothetical protein
MGKSLGSAARLAEQAVEVAWRSVDEPATADLAITRAAEELPSAVAQIFRGVLQGIVAFLLSKGAAAAASRVPELTAQLRGSRLGARFAAWVEQSWQRLITAAAQRWRLRLRGMAPSAVQQRSFTRSESGFRLARALTALAKMPRSASLARELRSRAAGEQRVSSA